MIKVSIPKEELEQLDIDFDTLSKAMGIIIAEKIKVVVSAYPRKTVSKTPGKSYYERGSGTIYVKKSGGLTRYKNSEMLGRKWEVVPSKDRTVLRNTASYAAYVNDSKLQSKLHAKTGWKTEKEAMASFSMDDVFEQAIRATGVPL